MSAALRDLFGEDALVGQPASVQAELLYAEADRAAAGSDARRRMMALAAKAQRDAEQEAARRARAVADRTRARCKPPMKGDF